MAGQQIVRDVAYCPHCGNESQQQVVTHYTRYCPPGPFTNYILVHCDTCQGPLLYQSDPDRARQANSGRKIARSDGFTLDDKILLWPKASTLHRSVPQRIPGDLRGSHGDQETGAECLREPDPPRP